MSRCFRFPPPGYEKEIRNGDIELLAKLQGTFGDYFAREAVKKMNRGKSEKHQAKKHKRAKKEKKKEGEERKDEERSEGKQKEKKDRKEKRKDKKKDKNKEKDKNRLTDEKRAGIRIEGNNGEKIAEKGLQIENGDSKFTAELLRRIRDEESCMGKQMVANFASTSQSRIEGTYGSNEETEKKVDGKEKVKGKAGNEKKTDRHKGRDRDRNRDREENRSIRDEERCMESQMVENFAGTSQSRIVEIRRPKEDTEKRVDGKEKDKTGDKKKSDRHKGRDRERDRDREENRSKGKVKEKDKERDKENEKEKEKVKKKGDRKHKEHSKHRESSKNDQIDPPLAIKATVPTKDGEKISFFTAKDKKDQIDPPLAIKATVPTKDSEKISFFTAKDKKDQIDAPLAIKDAVSAKDNEKISFTAKDKKDQIDAPLVIKAAVSAKESEKLSFFTAKDKKDQIDAPLAIKAAVSAKDNEKISFFTAKDKKDQIDAPLAIKAAVSAKDSEKISFFTAEDKKDQINPLLTIKPTFPTRGSEKLSLFPANNIEKTPSVEGNVRKRKDSETNGVFHDNYLQPSKLPRLDSSSHLQMENGRKAETGHRAIPFASERQAVSDNKKIERVFENKERKINGKIEAQPLSIKSRPAVCLETIENGGESSKRPHPDSQYLSQILSIPKTEEWSDFDDQDWLFGNDNNLQSKPKAGSEVDGGTPQVWEKTLRIESEDVYALPYVLPF